jgi:hypothetical protein
VERYLNDEPIEARPPSAWYLVGEIARGGMGAILKGRDVDLGRDIRGGCGK